MSYVGPIVAAAEAAGYLPLRPGWTRLAPTPPWLADVQRPGGIERLESRLGVKTPSALREFWQQPDLMRLLSSRGDADYLGPIEEDLPSWIRWGDAWYLVFCIYPHSGLVGTVPLNGEPNPPIYYGWEGDKAPFQEVPVRFSEFLGIALRSLMSRDE